jgi:hypothetical protein
MSTSARAQSSRALNVFCLSLALLLIFLAPAIFAKPRPPLPLLPEAGVLFTEEFDQSLRLPAQAMDATTFSESWSGYALPRRSAPLAPWVIPWTASGGRVQF